MAAGLSPPDWKVLKGQVKQTPLTQVLEACEKTSGKGQQVCWLTLGLKDMQRELNCACVLTAGRHLLKTPHENQTEAANKTCRYGAAFVAKHTTGGLGVGEIPHKAGPVKPE